MLAFQNNITAQPPINASDRQRALDGLRMKSPYAYSSQHQDVLDALGDQNAAKYNVTADEANADFANKKMQAERDFALQGLQQMSTAKQNQMDYANARSGLGYGVVNNLLSGLFR